MDVSSRSPRKQTVGEIYDSIVEELRTQYSMGYTPDKDSSASGYHHVQLAVKKQGSHRADKRRILRGSIGSDPPRQAQTTVQLTPGVLRLDGSCVALAPPIFDPESGGLAASMQLGSRFGSSSSPDWPCSLRASNGISN